MPNPPPNWIESRAKAAEQYRGVGRTDAAVELEYHTSAISIAYGNDDAVAQLIVAVELRGSKFRKIDKAILNKVKNDTVLSHRFKQWSGRDVRTIDAS